MLVNNQHYTTCEIANILKISKSITEYTLHQLGYVVQFDVWHNLSAKNTRLFKCFVLLSKLWHVIGKWIIFWKDIIGQVKWSSSRINNRNILWYLPVLRKIMTNNNNNSPQTWIYLSLKFKIIVKWMAVFIYLKLQTNISYIHM